MKIVVLTNGMCPRCRVAETSLIKAGFKVESDDIKNHIEDIKKQDKNFGRSLPFFKIGDEYTSYNLLKGGSLHEKINKLVEELNNSNE